MARLTQNAGFLLGMSVMLAACGTTGNSVTSGNTPVSQGPVTIVKGTTPVQLYSHVARQVRACWFNPTNPVLTKHVIRGEAGAGGASGVSTSIVIHEQTKDRKRGLKAFSIDFTPIRNDTRVITQNHKLPYALGQKLMSDVGYWSQGGPNCDGPSQTASGVSRGSISGPRVNR